MIVNHNKFQVNLLDICRSENSNIEVEIGDKKISSTLSWKILGFHTDDKLNFNENINKTCKSAGNQLNGLRGPKSFLGLKEKEVLVNSYIYSTFSYCSLVWML